MPYVCDRLARILTPELAEFYGAYYTERGIKLAKGTCAKAFAAGDDVGKVLQSLRGHTGRKGV